MTDLAEISAETMIDIAAFFGQAPHELHKIIHIMRVSQQTLVDLMCQHERTVKGTGMYVKPINYRLADDEQMIHMNTDHMLIMSYEITDDPLDEDEFHEINEFLKKVIRIDDDFEHVTIDDIKSLDLTNSGFM